MVAHGSKKGLSNDEFQNLANKIISEDTDFEKIDAAFLEFATPNIATVVKKQIEQNIKKIYIYPYFLNSGKHVSIDLPNIINTLQESCLLLHISEPTRPLYISYAVFCLKKKIKKLHIKQFKNT